MCRLSGRPRHACLHQRRAQIQRFLHYRPAGSPEHNLSMARIRSIKPGFASDSKVARLSLQARLTFLLLLPEADDEGRMVGSTKRLVGLLYPNDDKIGAVQVERWLKELITENMVIRYTADGTIYLSIVNFRKHQNPQHPTPSSFPSPHEDFVSDSRNPHESLTKSSSTSVEGEGEGVERERELSFLNQSSSQTQLVAVGSSEEEDSDFVVGRACRLVAERRLAARTGDPIVNRERWLAKAAGEVRAERKLALAELAAAGFTAEAIAAKIDPLPVSPYPAFDEAKPVVWQEMPDGSVMAVNA